MTEPLLSVRGLRAGYGDLEVLHGVDLDVRGGEMVALLGANGAGKTTLNKTLSGLLKPTGGEIHFDGRRIDGLASPAIVAAGLIHVPEGRKLYPNMSVKENLELGAYRRARAERRQNFDRVLTIFPRLRERLSQPAGTLSGGEQQMAAIGRGLMAAPKLLVLDEPSLGLAPRLVDEMFELIRQLNNDGVAVLLVEQNVVQSLEIATSAHVMEDGAITLSGSGRQLLDDDALAKAYLGM